MPVEKTAKAGDAFRAAAASLRALALLPRYKPYAKAHEEMAVQAEKHAAALDALCPEDGTEGQDRVIQQQAEGEGG